jgi:hypothetical protein
LTIFFFFFLFVCFFDLFASVYIFNIFQLVSDGSLFRIVLCTCISIQFIYVPHHRHLIENELVLAMI